MSNFVSNKDRRCRGGVWLLLLCGMVLLGVGCAGPRIEQAVRRHPNGAVAVRFSYYLDKEERPVIHGEHEMFYDNGVLHSHRRFVHGKVEGRAVFYLRSREIMYVTFKNDVAEGPIELQDQAGRVKWRGQCHNGRFDGRFVFYSPAGKPVAQGSYQNGVPHDGVMVVRDKLLTYQAGRLVRTEPLPEEHSWGVGQVTPPDAEMIVPPPR